MLFGRKKKENVKKLGRKQTGGKRLGQKNVNKSTKKRPVDIGAFARRESRLRTK
jgi:hypothetical protein